MIVSLLVAAVLAALIGAACSDGGPEPRGVRYTGDLEFTDCGDDLECARLAVPLDHTDPDGTTIDLAVARHRATGERIGALLVNPGGPGAPAVELARDAELIFPEEILERFDIVAWDPRGTGASAGVDCLDDLDPFFAVDRSPDTDAEVGANVEAAQAFSAACAREAADLLPHVSSLATVADMDRLRAALGEDRLTYLGFSYGTYLGALYADTDPERVRAMVLDGAVDPALPPAETARQQAVGFDAALDAFLDDCAGDEECVFHAGGDPQTAYDKLMAAIDAEPLYAEVGGEERELGPGEADIGVASALYGGRGAWPLLAEALVEAARGDGSSLLELADDYTGREPGGEYSDDQDAFYAIGCVDAPSLGDPETVEALAASVAIDAPRFGPATVWLGLPCSFWPAPPTRDPAPIPAVGAPPLLVLATANDPATPLAWGESLAAQLESGVLAVLEDEGHTAYARGNPCIDDLVAAYLVDLEVPENGTRCA